MCCNRALLLWEKGKRADLVQTLVASGRSEVFYRVAQAIGETTLPVERRNCSTASLPGARAPAQRGRPGCRASEDGLL